METVGTGSTLHHPTSPSPPDYVVSTPAPSSAIVASTGTLTSSAAAQTLIKTFVLLIWQRAVETLIY